MKRLLIISLFIVLILTGCNTNNKDAVQEANNTQQEIENISGESKANDEMDIYKLSDSYELDESAYIDLYNVVLIDNNYDEKTTENPYRFESDGKEYVIECKRVDELIRYNMTINGKETVLPNIDGGIVGVGIIDLDETDERKEVVIRRGTDGYRNNLVYKVNANNELEEISSIQLEQPYIVNSKYIFPITLLGDRTAIVIGYYIYENGELRYIDRLLTGEKTLNEDGMFPDMIRDEIYTVSAFYMQVEKDGKTLDGMLTEELTEPIISFRVLSAKWKYNEQSNRNDLVYEIELTEDARWIKDSDPDFEEIIPKGTILSDVSITYIWC